MSSQLPLGSTTPATHARTPRHWRARLGLIALLVLVAFLTDRLLFEGQVRREVTAGADLRGLTNPTLRGALEDQARRALLPLRP
jgi:hypothetical protein